MSLESFFAIDILFIIKATFAIIIGFLIGIEREYHAKPAGIKTYALICLGATIFTHISITLTGNTDPSRVAAQIVSGLGFIGGGAIFQSKKIITGLTTAASMWVIGGLGTLIGSGLFAETIFCLFIIHIYFTISRFTQNQLLRKSRFNLELLLYEKDAINQLKETLKNHSTKKMRLNWTQTNSQFIIECSYICKLSQHKKILHELNKQHYIHGIKSI